MTPPKIVAEIGCTHAGSVNRAKELIKLAHICGADFVKLQKRNPEESTPKDLWDKPHPNSLFAYGDTYLEHRKVLELDIDDHIVLDRYCKDLGIEYSTSVWDMTSAKEVVEQINPSIIKIPSACNHNHELLTYLFEHYNGQVHVSTGMSSLDEREVLFKMISPYRNRTVVYHCTSEYPCPFERLFLNEIKTIYDRGFIAGFSNHGYGIAADVAAFCFGASWVERHFIDDRTFRHTDASASLEPDGLRRLCRDLKNVSKSIEYRNGITEEELTQRNKLRTDD